MAKSDMKNTDIPGNAVGSHAAYVKQMVRQAETLMGFESVAEHMFAEEVFFRSMSIRFPEDDRPEYLAVVRVYWHGEKQVGFHSAPTLLELLTGVVNRLKNRSIKFREDSYD